MLRRQLTAVMRREWHAQRWIPLFGLLCGLLVPVLARPAATPFNVADLRYLLSLAVAGALLVGLGFAWAGGWLVREPETRAFDLALPLWPSCVVAGRSLVFVLTTVAATTLALLPTRLLAEPTTRPPVFFEALIARLHTVFSADPLYPWVGPDGTGPLPFTGPGAFADPGSAIPLWVVMLAPLVLLLPFAQLLGAALAWRNRWSVVDLGAFALTLLLASAAWSRLAAWHLGKGLRVFTVVLMLAGAAAMLAAAWAQLRRGGVLDLQKHRVHSLVAWPILLAASGLLAIYAERATAERHRPIALVDFASSAGGDTWVVAGSAGDGLNEVLAHRPADRRTWRLGPAREFQNPPLLSPNGRLLVWSRCRLLRVCKVHYRDLEAAASRELPIPVIATDLAPGNAALDDAGVLRFRSAHGEVQVWRVPDATRIADGDGAPPIGAGRHVPRARPAGLRYAGGAVAPGRQLFGLQDMNARALPEPAKATPTELAFGDHRWWQTQVVDLASGEVVYTLPGYLPARVAERGLPPDQGIVIDRRGWPYRLENETWRLEPLLPALMPPE